MSQKLRLTIVVPLYNTERYLPALLDSFEQQQAGPYELEFVFVDDGSPDRSGAISQQWLDTNAVLGKVVRQQNAGVSAARNRGLAEAGGDWITFIDSDDFIGGNYFNAVARFLQVDSNAEQVALVSCNVARYDEASDSFNYAHALRAKFDRGDRAYDLRDHPEFIQSQAASAFFPTDRLRESGVRFLEGLHAAEDAIFVASYILSQELPLIGCVAGANYFYRSRATGDSAVDTYNDNRGYYFERFSEGYLPLFERAAANGPVPRWLGQYFLYDMRWFFPRELSVKEKATHLSPAEKEEVISLVTAVLAYLHPSWVCEFSVVAMVVEQRELLLALMGAPLFTEGYVRAAEVDASRDAVRLQYYYSGDLPEERIMTGTRPSTVLSSKNRKLDYLGQSRLHERLVWVEADDDLTIHLNGVQQVITNEWLPPSQSAISRKRLGLDPYIDPIALPSRDRVGRPLVRRFVGRMRREAAAIAPRAFRGTRFEQLGMDLRHPRVVLATQIYAQRPSVRDRYRDAWLFIDRLSSADDNAEALYWYTAAQRQDVNAWFVIRRSSPHWSRLAKRGARLLEYGSVQHRAALMHSKFVISSNLDVEIVQPISDDYYWQGAKPWRFVYLQHGILQHDLSLWFNAKPIDLITTASVDEHNSLVCDDSSYYLTTLQAELTGFPRHDALVAGARESAGEGRRLVLFAPTWRNDMMGKHSTSGPERELAVDLMTSEFAANWFGLLNDPRLHEIGKQFNLDLAFLPHPNLRDKIPAGVLSENVRLMTAVPDMAQLMLQTKLLVTDYSSIFFDAAIAGADVSYFQFDHDHFLNGGHTYIPGYWSYPDHGFGPIAYDIDSMVELLTRQLDPALSAEFGRFRERVERTLPNLDGHAAERALQAILDLK